MMKTGCYFIFFVYSAVLMGVCFFLCVTIHELGHLLAGVLSGYRFSSFEIMGLYLVRTREGLKFGIRKTDCIGQCVMYSENFRKQALFLILGGILANTAAAAASAFILLSKIGGKIDAAGFELLECENDCNLPIYFVLFIFNMAAVICNMLPDNSTNDGSTFADARKSFLHTEAYNRIMFIYAGINEGYEFEEIDGEVFELPDMLFSSLSAELAAYRVMHHRGKDDGQEKNAMRRLEKYSPELIDPHFKGLFTKMTCNGSG